jgi:hypothetical protein
MIFLRLEKNIENIEIINTYYQFLFCIIFYNHRRFHETLAYKKPMDVYQESIKLNQEKAKAS